MEEILKKIKIILQTYDLKPDHSKGQNFLINSAIINDIIAAANLKKTDLVLEVGPGLGILTEALITNAKKVVSVELDKKLIAFLKLKFSGADNFTLVENDILQYDPTGDFKTSDYRIVANLPYNITSIFLRRYLSIEARPTAMVLMLQKEVAQRICAVLGKTSLLSLSVQLYAEPKIYQLIEKNNFWPKPAVDSAILVIDKIKKKLEVDKFLGDVSEEFFWRVAKIGFSARRKQLHNNLANGFRISPDDAKKMLIKANLSEQIRAQDLSILDWLAIAKQLAVFIK
ncbi:MAG: 16S rRNA (adenine(1518)-N(6)/adenine(1519)-N(6))-dimethyltransferase RsmA [Patescibacteria group bacterium]|nr:16S rRNA (adenine(1518)-N(6)/adenine(1519)-N(6))-dimethyltransferase RsmA [Patescibacteria group bacterium]